jgi:hypothetical protein
VSVVVEFEEEKLKCLRGETGENQRWVVERFLRFEERLRGDHHEPPYESLITGEKPRRNHRQILK